MANFPLTQRLAEPRVGDSRPWDDPAVQRTTGQVQQIMRRDYPHLLTPTDTSRQAQEALLARIQAIIAGDVKLQVPEMPVAALAHRVYDQLAGVGPLGALLDRTDVSEIMVNRFDDVWIEVDGRLARAPGVAFRDDVDVLQVAQRLLAPLGLELSAAKPLAEGRLPGDIRVAASTPPVGLHTTLTVCT
ncbi:MAG TPA: ATPase, T2SS/T4P/T4SS family [Symbiobacteriaceae bacterium]|nr:ATPase, T2SS/T4P/T4SS family [Symbiobacteriaceae bacterium]